MEDDTHTHTHTQFIKPLQRKKLSFVLQYFTWRRKYFGAKEDRQHFATVFWLLGSFFVI